MTPALPTSLRGLSRERLLLVLATLLGAFALAGPLAGAGAAATVDAATHDARAVIPTGCGELDLKDTAAVVAAARGADDVFVGKVVGVGGSLSSMMQQASPDASPTPGDRRPRAVRHHVVVTEPLLGDLVKGDPVRVELVATADSDPLRLRINRTYLLFTKDDGPLLRADACTGWVQLDKADLRRLAALRSALAAPPTPSPAPEVELSANPDVDRAEPELGRILAPGGALMLLGVLGLMVVVRIGRARP